MELKDVQEFLSKNAQDSAVKEYLEGLRKPTLEGIKSLVTSDESIKKWFDSEKDRHFDKGLSTWMEKTFPVKMEEEIKKRFPDETEDQKKIRELQRQNAALLEEKVLADVRIKAQTYATENKLPMAFVDMVISADESSTMDKLVKFQEHLEPYIKEQVEKQISDNSYTPPGNNNNTINTENLTPTQLMSQGFNK